MNTPSNSRISYALRDRASGQLARLRVVESRVDGPSEFLLDTSTDLPVFELERPEQLQQVLLTDRPRYSSSRTLPCWGDLHDAAQLEIVRVTVTQSIEPVELEPLPCVGTTIQSRAIPLRVAEKYAGRALELRKDVEPMTLFWLVGLPESETLASVQSWVGKDLYAPHQGAKRTAYAIVEPPEEYGDLVAGKNAVLVIASGLVA